MPDGPAEAGHSDLARRRAAPAAPRSKFERKKRRVSLADAAPGERVVLLPFAHQDADSPYRASGPIFVRENAREASVAVNEVPELLRLRMLGVRAYDVEGLMAGADVVDGRELEPAIERFFGEPRVEYLHVHFARPGCFACRVDRA